MCLSENPNAIHLLEQNPDKINWSYLSDNPNAIHLLDKNPNKISWKELLYNPSAMHLLEQNPDKINWDGLSFNPEIFEIDYTKLKERIEPFKEELIQKCTHHNRLERYLNDYNIGEDVYI